ncbi:hypothetical protein BJ684DRAFT_21585 [Piptocephalis cylindrospora]|uniref:Uncharacterized protein n=1 Tax=Piptocephalis cylindrospora TaxID=1907219 RepID=A0A4P9Y073_9FUNG|nr:hypothetical protein BJ684DRAFT_21585 [Piptocephalis cylindrospora]|eukprot:RKP11842.1 hypothetical protein BJ684DRAFT_21585 [Piptocephalis cylindrospora]
MAVTVDKSTGGSWEDQVGIWDTMGRAVPCSTLHVPQDIPESHDLTSSSIHTVALGGSGAGDPDGQCYLGLLTQSGWVGIWRLEHAGNCQCIEHRLFPPSSYPIPEGEVVEGVSEDWGGEGAERRDGDLRLRASWVGCIASPGSLDLVISDGCVYGVRKRIKTDGVDEYQEPLGAWEAWRLDASGVQEDQHDEVIRVDVCPLGLKDQPDSETRGSHVPFERVYSLLHRDPSSLYIEAGQGVCRVDTALAWEGDDI